MYLNKLYIINSVVSSKLRLLKNLDQRQLCGCVLYMGIYTYTRCWLKSRGAYYTKVHIIPGKLRYTSNEGNGQGFEEISLGERRVGMGLRVKYVS